MNGRRRKTIYFIFSFLPFMGKGARRAERGGKIPLAIIKNNMYIITAAVKYNLWRSS
jgi:hypothetical protein